MDNNISEIKMMRQNIKIPRIVKIEKIFKEWKVSENDFEFPLFDANEMNKLKLRKYTLSWPNIEISIIGYNGEIQKLPYAIGADVLYQLSEEIKDTTKFRFGNLIRNAWIKAGLTQEQLAVRSGTTRFYISRIENDKADLEMSTFRKIVDAGLEKNLKLSKE